MGMPWGPWGLRVVTMATNCLCSRQNLGWTEEEFHTMRTRIDFLTHWSDSTAEFPVLFLCYYTPSWEIVSWLVLLKKRKSRRVWIRQSFSGRTTSWLDAKKPWFAIPWLRVDLSLEGTFAASQAPLQSGSLNCIKKKSALLWLLASSLLERL